MNIFLSLTFRIPVFSLAEKQWGRSVGMNSLQLCPTVSMSDVEMLREPMGHLGPEQRGWRGQECCNKREVARMTSGSQTSWTIWNPKHQKRPAILLETAGADGPGIRKVPRIADGPEDSLFSSFEDMHRVSCTHVTSCGREKQSWCRVWTSHWIEYLS